ncbi:TfoX/Sxy family protein [Azorhizobium doebereinerae]|uniref:TfoX/Sxy family protein n=1 Tax=Azorhizobium doebereinerae TaxID=281091 RepID=UPI0003F4E0EC|nr:TfoX/Sxy family protein [Azorhizobium doebereinerae]
MDKDELAEMFVALGPVQVRRMFGGHGIFRDGLMFALETRGTLFVKADAAFSEDLAGQGSRPLGYEARGRQVRLPYWTLPDAALDDDELRDALFRRALDVSRAVARAPRGKTAKAPAEGAAPHGPPPDLDLLGLGGGSPARPGPGKARKTPPAKTSGGAGRQGKARG